MRYFELTVVGLAIILPIKGNILQWSAVPPPLPSPCRRLLAMAFISFCHLVSKNFSSSVNLHRQLAVAIIIFIMRTVSLENVSANLHQTLFTVILNLVFFASELSLQFALLRQQQSGHEKCMFVVHRVQFAVKRIANIDRCVATY